MKETIYKHVPGGFPQCKFVLNMVEMASFVWQTWYPGYWGLSFPDNTSILAHGLGFLNNKKPLQPLPGHALVCNWLLAIINKSHMQEVDVSHHTTLNHSHLFPDICRWVCCEKQTNKQITYRFPLSVLLFDNRWHHKMFMSASGITSVVIHFTAQFEHFMTCHLLSYKSADVQWKTVRAACVTVK